MLPATHAHAQVGLATFSAKVPHTLTLKRHRPTTLSRPL
eukprot:SAG31_NODE_34863_length_328_cov_1.021834_1_plen_38_part_10